MTDVGQRLDLVPASEYLGRGAEFVRTVTRVLYRLMALGWLHADLEQGATRNVTWRAGAFYVIDFGKLVPYDFAQHGPRLSLGYARTHAEMAWEHVLRLARRQ